MKINVMFVTAIGCLLSFVSAYAQNTSKEEAVDVVRKQKQPIVFIDDRDFSPFYVSGKAGDEIYNLSSIKIGAPGQIVELCHYPAYTMSMIATLTHDVKGRSAITSFVADNDPKTIKFDTKVSSLAFTPDGRNIVVAFVDSSIVKYDALQFFNNHKKSKICSFKVSNVPTKMKISPNMYYVASAKGNTLYIWNLESGVERQALKLPGLVNSFDFSDDNTMLAVLCDGGEMTVYDTRDFKVLKTFSNLGNGLACHFHEEGKYVAVLQSDKTVSLINIKDKNDKEEISSDSYLKYLLGFIKNVSGDYILVYTSSDSYILHTCTTIAPNRQRLVEDQVKSRLSDWAKQQAGETSEQYRARVNDETRLAQARLFENELATSLAGSLLDDTEITFGGYSSDGNVLTVNFNTMPSIFLEVPEDDMSSFTSADDLTFMNTIYGLTESDNFEVLYTEVLNKSNGKTYVFDNKERRSLEFMSMKDDFVPIEVMQLTSADQIKLEELREDVMEEAKQDNLISDHTNISVNSNVESATDADGNRIYNYHVQYNYNVDMSYSAKDDFGPGRYAIEESQAALAMLQIIKKAFEGDFSQYVKAGKKLHVKISGMADATPIVHNYNYKGEYGQFENALMYNRGELSTINITKGQKLTRNEELAFLRAQGVKQYVLDNIPAFTQMNAVCDTNIEVSEGAGSQYRRISVEFTFIDAFNN